MTACLVHHGPMLSRVVYLDGDRYEAGTLLPETRRFIDCAAGSLKKSFDETIAALYAQGYSDAPLAMRPVTSLLSERAS